MKDIITLGIESSCDETSASIVKNGRQVLSNVINSQIKIHEKFAIEELLARIRLVLKKSAGQQAFRNEAGLDADAEEKKLTFGKLTLDERRYEVLCGEEPVSLTNREFELLKILLENKNIVMTRDTLLDRVCGYEYAGETNVIDVYIRYLRSKIDERFGMKMIQTVRGVGYVIREDKQG